MEELQDLNWRESREVRYVCEGYDFMVSDRLGAVSLSVVLTRFRKELDIDIQVFKHNASKFEGQFFKDGQKVTFTVKDAEYTSRQVYTEFIGETLTEMLRVITKAFTASRVKVSAGGNSPVYNILMPRINMPSDWQLECK